MCCYVTLVLLLSLMPCLCAGLQCDFESPCEWEGTTLEDEHGFQVMTSADFAQLPREKGEQISAPTKDADSDEDGHYLYFRSKPNMDKVHAMVSSPWFTESELGCTLNMFVHMGNMQDGSYRIFVESRETAWDIIQQPGDDLNKWIQKSQLIGRITQEFRIVVEVVQGNLVPSHIALDNLKLINCFPDPLRSSDCGQNKFKCDSSLCIKRDRVCDLTEDCLLGEDERESCDEMPESSVCTFEKNLCGWKNLKSDQMEWTLHNGSTPTERTGPSYDHTYKNISGSYLYIEASNYKLLGHVAILESPVFNPPPRYHGDTSSRYFNVCKIRFFYHMFGNHIGFLNVYVEEKSSKFSRGWKHDIWEMSKNMGNVWLRGTAILPNITNRYTIQFHARRGIRYSGDIAIDDISLSPECFGINVPDNETVHYPIESDHISYHHNYREHNRTDQSILRLSTCGSKGRYGPTQRECDYAYNSSHIKILLKDGKSTGIQQWTVPSSTIYTIVAIGASGGRGVRNNGKSYGGMAKAAFNLTEGEKIFILVGQKGIDACSDYPNTDISLMHQCSRNSKLKRDLKSLKELTRLSKIGGGGGGGGATYVFKVDSYSNQLIPLLVAGGGGGFSSEVNMENVFASNAVAFNGTQSGLNGYSSRIDAGSGGGWKDKTKYFSSGFSLVEGGFGGSVCKSATKWYTDGGFGGGGGACSSGGGGGGYTGGNSTHGMSSGRNGKGGTSFISRYGLFPNMGLSQHLGDGQVIIIKAFTGCGCEHLCVVVDHATMGFRCICPTSFILESDGFTCQPSESALKENIAGSLSDHYLIIIIIGAVSFAILFFVALIFACNSYRNHMAKQLQQEGLMNAELQLSRLRQATGGMITEYNPNYEFGGGTCSVQDLKQVSRESLTLVKALGQGAFGEVYQGYLSNIPDEPGNVPVAVKTLPELSSNQAELDFLTEAQIMSKFNHPNIVRFIGVCFEKLPQFIVLELLSGGDLKSFLRESRPKPMKNSNLNSSSPLTMRDLLMLAVDVAKGCQYLEEHHFIHRDIAARNCLLTTKGAGRIVKIADFGMARDVYRADYYRKGGKAMLPVKWMPPEAFLDGIFTSKTDIWSFGVLIWEVMSLGYMPYPGRGNQEVMQLVTSGGRLEPPSNCPQPMYHIMTQCWHPVPEQRPNFMTILERLGYCLQDPDVINSPLPVFYRPPSTERDATVMRPNNETDGACLQVQRSLTNSSSADYLIPIPSSNYSISTEKTELHSPSSVESMTKLLELDDNRSSNNSQIPPKSLCWETSFSDEKLGDINDPPLDSIPTPPPPPRSSILSNAVRPRRPEGYTKIPSQDDDLHNAAMPDNMPYSYLSNGKVTNPCNSIARSAPPNRYSDNPYNKVNKDSQDKNGMVVKPSPIGKMRKADDGNKYNPSVDQRHSSLSLDASALCRQANGQPQPVPYVNVPISQSGRSNLPLVRALSCDRYSPNSLQNTNQPRGANQSSPSIERGHQDGEVNC